MIEELLFDAHANRSYNSADGSDRISLYSPSIFYSSVAQTATRERKKGSRVARREDRENTDAKKLVWHNHIIGHILLDFAVSGFIQDELLFRQNIT